MKPSKRRAASWATLQGIVASAATGNGSLGSNDNSGDGGGEAVAAATGTITSSGSWSEVGSGHADSLDSHMKKATSTPELQQLGGCGGGAQMPMVMPHGSMRSVGALMKGWGGVGVPTQFGPIAAAAAAAAGAINPFLLSPASMGVGMGMGMGMGVGVGHGGVGGSGAGGGANQAGVGNSYMLALKGDEGGSFGNSHNTSTAELDDLIEGNEEDLSLGQGPQGVGGGVMCGEAGRAGQD
ncbi:unnamed protein product, partial [Discosporangium mesarthrocarpum]